MCTIPVLCFGVNYDKIQLSRRDGAERGTKMQICQMLLDDRINDNTTVVIKDTDGTPIKCGRWYQDKILIYGSFHASFDFVADRNIAIFQLV